MPIGQRWTSDDFDTLSWHDNHVHGISIVPGDHGWGELVLDLDFILAWIPAGGHFQFQVAMATLVFHSVTGLQVELDYVGPQAAISPISLTGISRERLTYPTGYSTYRWLLGVNWPEGHIIFEASGFTQVLTSEPIITSEQYLSTRILPLRKGV